ncbi:MAG: hypothetical protein ACRDKY_12560 [Solirubrobacteraceae bacterium]
MTTSPRDAWTRLGALPALPVVAGAYVVLFPIVLVLDNPARRIAGCVLIALLALYCAARPRGRAGVFFLAGVPALICTVLDDVFAWPRWTGLCFLPFAVALAWFQDHPDEPGEAVAPPQ